MVTIGRFGPDDGPVMPAVEVHGGAQGGRLLSAHVS